MLKHLTRQRTLRENKYKEFSYRKALRNSYNSRGRLSQVIVWDVFYNSSFIQQFENLSEVKKFIKEKAET
jgi:hypothetical protein